MRFIKSIAWVIFTIGSVFAISGVIADRIRSVPNFENTENAKPILRILDAMVVFGLSLAWNNPGELVFIVLVLASAHYLLVMSKKDTQKEEFERRRLSARDRERSKKVQRKREKGRADQ